MRVSGTQGRLVQEIATKLARVRTLCDYFYDSIFRALEGMFRSLNSLLERFHQSFFFYLLSSTSRYISIGLYMPPLGCVMIGPIFTAISCWFSSVDDEGILQSR